jgi:NADH:ubiquinone oxidoreductase subunit 3 (subunit A)
MTSPIMAQLLTIFLAFTVTAAAALLFQVLLLAVDRRPRPAPQGAPFLGGGTPDTHAWSRWHVRFYTMTLLFIAFEMEMMFMYPWAVVYVAEGTKALMEMGMFLAILSLGILYGWREGVFRWQ